MKNSYLCIVKMNDGEDARARQEYFSGAPRFTACPARKNFVRKATSSVN